ncbi:P-loop containing nucleoside triphosphate hydrolase protein, partial [Mycena floridula]
LCKTFHINSLRPFQEKARQNSLQGIDTILDVPTGGGKTLAFFYSLFYYLGDLDDIALCQKIVLVIGPISVLLESQVQSLLSKGIPAIALTSTDDKEDESLLEHLKDCGANKYRIGFIGPEMALQAKFQSLVLKSEKFYENLVQLVIDEAHCITEWGTDDFRPAFAEL